MLTLTIIIAVSAVITAILSLAGKCPVIVPVMLLSFFAAVQVIPK